MNLRGKANRSGEENCEMGRAKGGDGEGMGENREGRVATNLEYSGFSLNTENSGNSVQPRGKFVTNKVVLVCRSNICVKQLLTDG